MKQILQLQSKKIEACEETGHQDIYTDALNVEIEQNRIIIDDNDECFSIHIDEFLQLCDYVKENHNKK